MFLLLTSTGIRAGALHSLRIRDLEKIDDVYKVTVYSGDKEEYLTFCTPECAKEIDTNLEFRKRHGEKITGDSYLIVKNLTLTLNHKRKAIRLRFDMKVQFGPYFSMFESYIKIKVTDKGRSVRV